MGLCLFFCPAHIEQTVGTIFLAYFWSIFSVYIVGVLCVLLDALRKQLHFSSQLLQDKNPTHQNILFDREYTFSLGNKQYNRS